MGFEMQVFKKIVGRCVFVIEYLRRFLGGVLELSVNIFVVKCMNIYVERDKDVYKQFGFRLVFGAFFFNELRRVTVGIIIDVGSVIWIAFCWRVVLRGEVFMC